MCLPFVPVGQSNKSSGLRQMVDSVIQSCPIDTRRALYDNIVLSVRAPSA